MLLTPSFSLMIVGLGIKLKSMSVRSWKLTSLRLPRKCKAGNRRISRKCQTG